MTPAVSICTPVYKGVAYLEAAVASVRAQTFPDWELILVDDGSRDGSGALADHLAETDARIRVIHQANAGTSVARNTALDAARGTYLAFLDEDDLWHPRYLETLHAAAVSTGADIVGCERTCFQDGAQPDFTAEPPVRETWKRADAVGLRDWIASFYTGVPFEVWLNLYRRDIVDGHRFKPGVRVEQDMLWHYTLLPRCRLYVRIPWVGYAWRENAANGSLLPKAESLVSLTESFLEILDTADRAFGLSPEQARSLRTNMAPFLKHNVLTPLRNGLVMDAGDSARLVAGCRALARRGVDIRPLLGFRKRVLWSLFLLTGRVGVVARRARKTEARA